MTNKTFIHYGHKQFNIQLFEAPTNRPYSNKPYGGLWASAVDAPYGWKRWCDDEHFRNCEDSNSFKFNIADNANIFEINSVADVELMPLQKDSHSYSTYNIRAIDFEAMHNNSIDVIVFNLSNSSRDNFFNDLYFALYGWDCDCILVLNPNVVIPCCDDNKAK